MFACLFFPFIFPFQTTLAQQCPNIVNCPQGTPTYCDYSTNDPFLWNDAPYTHSPTLGNHDMHEAEIDLSIRLRGCNGGGLGQISYTLYLDLDNDGVQESAFTSNNPPPAGRVFMDNIFNPGFSGGDTVWFDRHPLPESLLYRFTISIDYSGDTTTAWVRFCTDDDPFHFYPVMLPEGRHRIEWRAAQDSVVRFCDRNFKVKDCKGPDLDCEGTVPTYLNATQTAMLSLNEVMLSVSDNISPDSQLILGMRRVGSGSGFPLDAMGNPQDTVMFSCADDDEHFVELWAQDFTGNLSTCITKVLVYDTAGYCPFTPFPSICARNYWNQEILRDVRFNMQWVGPNQLPVVAPLSVIQGGCADLFSLPPANTFQLHARKDSFPLNGVTTYDLVLISKHILSIEPFDAGWKIAAADANRSNSVTSFDIVELRKLILGIYDHLPNASSWRFFVDTCTVWGTPFFGTCPNYFEMPVLPIGSYPQNITFRALKVGDVNGSASSVDTLQGSAQPRGNPMLLHLPDLSLNAGETLEIPLCIAEGGTWEGFQLSLHYDHERLDIEAVLPGDALEMEADHWAISRPGQLQLSWSDGFSRPLLPGDVLLRLQVRARSTTRVAAALSIPENGRLNPEAYDPSGAALPLQLEISNRNFSSEQTGALWFSPQPNPTISSTRLPLRLFAPETVAFDLFDLQGKLCWQTTLDLDSGAHFIDIPASAMPEAAVYLWRATAGASTQSGRIVRQ